LGPDNHRELLIDEHIDIGQTMTVRPRKVSRWIVMSSFGNPQVMKPFCTIDLREWTRVGRLSTSGEITLGEKGIC
jgi:hypothetical protein